MSETEIKVLDISYDDRIDAHSILTEITYKDYINLISHSLSKENLLDIQRDKMITQKKHIYRRLTEDLKIGTIIPPISLVLLENETDNKFSFINNDNISSNETIEETENILNESKNKELSILDGLQRTYCLLIAKEQIEKNAQQHLFSTNREKRGNILNLNEFYRKK